MELTWLLCNKCFVHLREAKSPFSLTQCGHLFCRKCIAKVGDRCPVCNAHGVESVCLTTPLQPMIVPIFEDVFTVAEKFALAAKFQKYQLSILIHREQELKYLALKTAYWQVAKQVEKLNQEYNALKTDYADLIAQNNARDHAFYKEPTRSGRVTFSKQNIIFGKNQTDSRNIFRPGSGNESEGSDVSGSTIRGLHTPRIPDGTFRVPTATRVPRSAGTLTPSSRISTPMSLDYDQNGRGYGSDTSAYFRR
ncbi:RING finger protein 212B isoform X2 [Diachasma alloeum]|uniref:RING finger protein 212B isoform X2 n=1 Tax=Diachasma alloeum TaxID=454923 RepID=UPI0007383414|nr:RING finger protein 212B isoform X2 [Diachasma alloeum]